MFKKILRITALVCVSLAALLGAFLLYVGLDGIPRYKATPPVLNVERTPERVARDKKLKTGDALGRALDVQVRGLP